MCNRHFRGDWPRVTEIEIFEPFESKTEIDLFDYYKEIIGMETEENEL